MSWWLIVLIVFIGFGLLFILSHYYVTYLIFTKFFKRQKNEKILRLAYHNLNEEQTTYLKESIRELHSHPHHEIKIKSYDNKILVGDLYKNSSDRIIILFHGFQADNYMNFGVQALYFLKHNYNVLIIDERAHKRSEGKYITYGYYEHHDVLSWIEYASSLKDIKEIILYGISMGGTSIALASEKIKENKVKHLIIEDAYTNLEKLADNIATTQHIPFGIFKRELGFYIKHLSKTNWNDIDTAKSLANNKIHTIFVRSEKDSIVDISFFNDNYNNCAAKKDKIFVPEAKHAWATLYGKESYLNELNKYLGENN